MALRTTILAAAGLGLASSVSAASGLTSYASSNNTVPHVTLEQGAVQGFRDNYTNSVYLGIPYAATTGGENR
jgi:galactitol-specific phosphotransferase system IIB component